MQAMWILSLMAAVFVAPTTNAAPLDRALVSMDAEWFVHVNVKAFNDSTIGRFVMENADQLDIDIDELDDLEEKIGIDPRTDLIAVTVYGWHEDDQERLVVVAVTTPKADEALAKLQEEHDLATRRIDGHEVYVVDDDGPLLHLRRGDRRDQRIAVVAENEASMKRGLAVLDGRAPALDEASKLALADPRPGSFLFVAASDLEGWNDAHGASELFRLSDAFVLDVGEHNDMVRAYATVRADTKQDASDLADIMQGMVALGRVLMTHEGDLAPLRAIADTLDITADGDRLTVSVKFPTDELTQILEEVIIEH